MPNIWTHAIFGRELATRLHLDELTASPYIQRVYQLGCQGPDFLFYHRFLPWQKAARMGALGSAMHQRRCGPFLLDLLRSAAGQPLESTERAYALGFLTHHILDRNAHPYVFYYSGFKKWDHQRFEIIVDTLVAKERLGIDTWKTPVWKEFDVGPQLPDAIAPQLDKLARTHYPELAAPFTASDWNKAYRDMVRAQKLFHDPLGWKRVLTAGQIEPFVFKKRNAPLDYLNLQENEWRHPSILEERHRESFWALWTQALEDGMKTMSAAVDCLRLPASGESNVTTAAEMAAPAAAVDKITGILTNQASTGPNRTREAWDRLEASLGDISYETGKPCAEGHEIRHVAPML